MYLTEREHIQVKEPTANKLTGRVHSMETFGTVDGPGTRFVVFLQGCYMRCLYCHNRDTWEINSGTIYDVDSLVKEIVQYKAFMNSSGGGVTITGGEPLLQAEFVAEVFRRCREEGIHTCLDTNGNAKVKPSVINAIEQSDLILLDIKHTDDELHHQLTGVSNRHTLELCRYMAARGKKVWIRHVVVEGFTASAGSAQALAEMIAPMGNVEKVELLPYHELGKHKWEMFGDSYSLDHIAPPSPKVIEDMKEVFAQYGITATS